MTRPLVGIFVGGRARRMGGIAKGLLPAPDGTGSLVARLAGLAGALGAEVVLVGQRSEYAALALPVLPDAAPDAGPLGGLVALLALAGERPAVALACDLPFLDAAYLTRLLAAPPAPVVAPRRDRWEPLAARYDAAAVLPLARARLAAGELALQGLLDAAGAVPLAPSVGDDRRLVDWDTPDDR